MGESQTKNQTSLQLVFVGSFLFPTNKEMMKMNPNWELKNCCNHKQVVFLVTVVILALWRTVLLTPFKLVTVILHEANHAIACKLTCGHVHADEGGTTHTRGGIYWLILPTRYFGSSSWGMVLILASTNLLTARIAAGCFVVALFIVLYVAKNALILFQGGKLLDLVDPTLEKYSRDEATMCIQLGLLCCQQTIPKRPDMNSVHVMLSSDSFPFPSQ